MKHNIIIPDKLNFTFAEMFRSDYAIRLDINNVTSDAKILTTIMTTICCLLQPIRTLCNIYDIEVTDNDLSPYKNYTISDIIISTYLSIMTGEKNEKYSQRRTLYQKGQVI